MRGLLLLSGGIDSIVAGYLMSKKIKISAVHFDNKPFTGDSELDKTKELCKKVGIKKLFIVKHGEYQKEVMKNCNRKFQCVMCRRMMFRVSEELARKEGFDFLITGENLAQVASQTLKNLKACDKASSLVILRPLLCYDKNDIIKIARQINTYNISTLPGVCCMAVPSHPATKANIEYVEKEEEKLEIKQLVKNALNSIETKEF